MMLKTATTEVLQQRHKSMKRVEIESWKDVKFTSPSSLSVVDEEYKLSEGSQDILLHQSAIPVPFFKRNPEKLQMELLNYHVAQQPDENCAIYVAKDTIIGMSNPRKPYVPYVDVIKVLEDIIPSSNFKSIVLQRDGNIMVASITSTETVAEPRVGDLTEGGLNFTFSDIGIEAPDIEMYANRLVCSNGMIVPQKMGRWSLVSNTAEGIIEELEEKAREVFERVEENLLTPFSHLVEEQVLNPSEAIGQLAKQYGLSSRMTNRLLEQVSLLPKPCSMYDILNLVTALVHETTQEGAAVFSERQIRNIQLVGGQLIKASHHNCPICNSER